MSRQLNTFQIWISQKFRKFVLNSRLVFAFEVCCCIYLNFHEMIDTIMWLFWSKWGEISLEIWPCPSALYCCLMNRNNRFGCGYVFADFRIKSDQQCGNNFIGKGATGKCTLGGKGWVMSAREFEMNRCTFAGKRIVDFWSRGVWLPFWLWKMAKLWLNRRLVVDVVGTVPNKNNRFKWAVNGV